MDISNKFAIISKSAIIAIFDLKTKQLISTLTGTKGNIKCFHLFNDKSLFSFGTDKKIRRWNINSKLQFKLTEKVIKVDIDNVGGSGGGNRISNGISNGIGNGVGNGWVYLLKVNENFISIVFENTNNIQVLNQNDGNLIYEFSGHTNKITEILYYQKDYIISSSLDSTIRFWNLDLGISTKILSGHLDSINSIKILNNILISGSNDKTIRYWNINSGECIGKFDHSFPILSFNQSFDGISSSSSFSSSNDYNGSKRLSFKLENEIRKCIGFLICGHCKKKILVCNHGNLKENIPFCQFENNLFKKNDFCFHTGFASSMLFTE